MTEEPRAGEPAMGSPLIELVAEAQAAVNAAARTALDDAARGDLRALRAMLALIRLPLHS